MVFALPDIVAVPGLCASIRSKVVHNLQISWTSVALHRVSQEAWTVRQKLVSQRCSARHLSGYDDDAAVFSAGLSGRLEYGSFDTSSSIWLCCCSLVLWYLCRVVL